MPTDTMIREREYTDTAPGKPETLPLEKALEQIHRDSREKAEEFLDETVVPHGGE
ncbi:MAG: hypothetical protein H8E44_27855 [Planctomycetes bacterium]|nr:hypothetical protein [Planctomycetota bacterium]MBL7039330.1 hypothetical protein [Pirellulaceae bacterium]